MSKHIQAISELEAYLTGMFLDDQGTPIIHPEKEVVLASILDFDAKWKEFVTHVKERAISELSQFPDTRAASGALVSLSVYGSGEEFSFETTPDEVDPSFLNHDVSIDTTAVRLYEKVNAKLPHGIVRNERKKSIRLTRKKPL